MSDTHAQTANVQAEVQTGTPHVPPGRVEAPRPVKRPEARSRAPWLGAAALGVIVVLAAIFLLA